MQDLQAVSEKTKYSGVERRVKWVLYWTDTDRYGNLLTMETTPNFVEIELTLLEELKDG
jgi:hypothetical protein